MRKIYVASSWRNEFQQKVVEILRAAGHQVYDFRHPEPGNEGFHWSDVDPKWKGWTPREFVASLDHPVAEAGFGLDMNALNWCDTCVLVLPCGKSAHLELGFACGAMKDTVILMEDHTEPELMYKMVNRMLFTTDELVEYLKKDYATAMMDAAHGVE